MFLVRAIHIGATVLAAGAFAFFFLIARGALKENGAGAGADVDRWLRLITGWSLLVALASWLAWFALVSASMSGRAITQALAPDIAITVLTRTTFGHVWTLRLALMALLAGELFVSRKRTPAGSGGIRWLGGVLTACLLMTLAGAGHAVATERPDRLLHLASDAAHLLAAGLWLGALVPLLLVLTRARAGASGWHAFAADTTERFSAVGVFAVAMLLATGVINAWLLVGSFSALVETPYGQMLSLKLALFGVIIAIAAVNRLKLRPRLLTDAESDGAPRAAITALWRNVIVEICLGAIILLIVGVLGVTPPSIHMRMHEHMHEHVHPHM